MIEQGRHTSRFLSGVTKLWITTSSELARAVCSVFVVVANDLVHFTTVFSKQLLHVQMKVWSDVMTPQQPPCINL